MTPTRIATVTQVEDAPADKVYLVTLDGNVSYELVEASAGDAEFVAVRKFRNAFGREPICYMCRRQTETAVIPASNGEETTTQ